MPSFVFLISKSVGELSQKSKQDAFISFKYQNLSVNCLQNRVGEFWPNAFICIFNIKICR